MHFYLTTNINRSEPDAVRQALYTHVKAKCDGSQTAIISDDEIVDNSAQEMTQEELQAVLDSWIDAENAEPGLDLDGNLIIQSYVSLGAFLCN